MRPGSARRSSTSYLWNRLSHRPDRGEHRVLRPHLALAGRERRYQLGSAVGNAGLTERIPRSSGRCIVVISLSPYWWEAMRKWSYTNASRLLSHCAYLIWQAVNSLLS